MIKPSDILEQKDSSVRKVFLILSKVHMMNKIDEGSTTKYNNMH